MKRTLLLGGFLLFAGLGPGTAWAGDPPPRPTPTERRSSEGTVKREERAPPRTENAKDMGESPVRLKTPVPRNAPQRTGGVRPPEPPPPPNRATRAQAR